MADYRTITDAEVDPDAPLTSSLGYAFRDNPTAIAEGATGAPRIQDGALDTSVTGAGTTWVMNRIIPRNAGGIGTYVFASTAAAGAYSINDTLAGASLTPSSADGAPSGSGTLNGTWRLHGLITGSSVPGSVSLWQRIS